MLYNKLDLVSKIAIAIVSAVNFAPVEANEMVEHGAWQRKQLITKVAVVSNWSALTTSQQVILNPLKADWDTLDSRRKAKWLDIASRFPRMPREEQVRVQARMSEWANLTSAARGQSRAAYQAIRSSSPSARQKQWREYQALPEGERKALILRSTGSVAHPELFFDTIPAPRVRTVVSSGKSASISAKDNLPGVTGTTSINPKVASDLHAASQSNRNSSGSFRSKIIGSPAHVNKNTLLPLDRRISMAPGSPAVYKDIQ